MALFFYIFASYVVISSLMVVTSKNPVYSVLWLIFAFCNSAGLMILLGAEFLAMMLIIIYVGAVAVLFLFVVMMLNINFAEIKGELKRNISLTAIVALIMLADLVLIIMVGTKAIALGAASAMPTPVDIENSYAIGNVLYTDFILPFQSAGIILFIAMIACISLTLRHRPGVKRQDPLVQLARNKDNTIANHQPVLKAGIEGIKYDE